MSQMTVQGHQLRPITQPVEQIATIQSLLNYTILTKKVFKAALELFNKQIDVSHRTSSSTSVSHRWECKGEISVSLQMCVSCKDIGKMRSRSDKYYVDVMEVQKYRTVLCKGCLAYILHENVGSCLRKIEEELQELIETKIS